MEYIALEYMSEQYIRIEFSTVQYRQYNYIKIQNQTIWKSIVKACILYRHKLIILTIVLYTHVHINNWLDLDGNSLMMTEQLLTEVIGYRSCLKIECTVP